MPELETTAHVVAWSGGCDSTVILYRAAQEWGTTRHPVLAITVDHNQVSPAQRAREAKARERILKWMEKKGLHVQHGVIKVEHGPSAHMEPGGIPQLYLWAIHVVGALPQRACLYFGYIKGDDAWSRIERVKTAIANYAALLDKEVEIVFTLEFTGKPEIIAELKEAGLYELCWYCEMPKNGKPCGDCKSCRTHLMAEEYLNRWPK